MSNTSRPLYVFLDESGQFDFSETGSRHFVLAAITTLSPLTTAKNLQSLKYNLLVNPLEKETHEYFHASEDKQAVRDKVFDSLLRIKENLFISYIWADKRKAHPSLQNKINFYGLLGSSICKYLLKRWSDDQYNKIIIVFDKLLSQKEEKAFLQKVKPELKKLNKPYAIYWHRTQSDFNSQIADYMAWAKYVSLEKNEQRPLEALEGFSISEFDIFNKGTHYYY